MLTEAQEMEALQAWLHAMNSYVTVADYGISFKVIVDGMQLRFALLAFGGKI